MGMGIAFGMFLVAVVLAPLLWASWWGFDYLMGGAEPRTSALRRHGTFEASSERREAVTMRSSFISPRPSDMPLVGRTREVAICRLSDGLEVGHCRGPNHSGRCPRPLDDGSVPCAGCLLALPLPIRGRREWHIPAGYRACLLGSYDVYRQLQ